MTTLPKPLVTGATAYASDVMDDLNALNFGKAEKDLGNVDPAMKSLWAANHGGISIFLNSSPSTTLNAVPVFGGRLIIDGVVREFPMSGGAYAGITGDASALTPSTVYFVYAYWTGATIALEFSTTGHSTSYAAPFPGIEIKTGDATRTLVGMVYVHSDGNLKQDAGHGTVLNWFHQEDCFIAGTGATVNVTTVQPSWQEIGTAGINLIPFLCWGPKRGRQPRLDVGISGTGKINAVDGRMDVVFGVTSYGADNSVSSYMTITSSTANAWHNLSGSSTMSYPEGYYEVNVWARVYNGAHTGQVIVNTFASYQG